IPKMIAFLRKYHVTYKLLVKLLIISGFVYQIYDQTINYLEYEVNTDLKFDRNSRDYSLNLSITVCVNKEYSVYKNKTIHEYFEYIHMKCIHGVGDNVNCAQIAPVYFRHKYRSQI